MHALVESRQLVLLETSVSAQAQLAGSFCNMNYSIWVATCVNYCMVCAYLREDNPRVFARGLSPVHTHNHT